MVGGRGAQRGGAGSRMTMGPEETDADDEMDLTRQADESGGDDGNEEPIPGRSWEGREFRQAERMKKQVLMNDKLLRSKRDDPTRAELYDKLTKYFKVRPLEKAKMYYEERHLKLYEELCTPEPVFAHNTRLNKRKKVQDITQYIMDNTAKDFIHSTCAMMDLTGVVTIADKLTWRAYSLHCASGQNTEIDNLDRKELKEAVEEFVVPALKKYAETLPTPTQFFDHWRIRGRFCFVLLRAQNKTNPKFTNTVFAFAPGLRSLLIHFDREADTMVTKIIAAGLGFGIFKPQRLRALGLNAVYESCIRTVMPLEEGIPLDRPDGPIGLRAFITKIDQQEKEKNERGVHSLFPVAEKRLKLQCALLDDDQPPGVDVCTIIYKVPAEPDEGPPPPASSAANEPKMCEIKWKVRARKGTLDKNFAEMYRHAKISDVTPYLGMKKSKSNTITVKRPNC